MRSTSKIKLALVHDDFIQFGGAEKFYLELTQEFLKDKSFEITVYSSLISKEWKDIFEQNKIPYYESFLAKFPFCYKFNKLFFLFNYFYYAFGDFDLNEYDCVISSSTRFGHFLITKPSTYHISYLNSPSRALWDEKRYFYGKKFLHFFTKNFLPQKRLYDYYSQQYADLVISNSKNIQNKVTKYYQRKSIILYPFSKLPKPSNQVKEDYFLIISRLVSWKRLDYVIEAFNQNQKNLIVIGSGPELENYQKQSSANIVFTGFVAEEEKNNLLSKAKALIFPQSEDFGLTLIEALNQSCPIIYYNSGGAKEVLNPKLGIAYNFQTSESLNEALQKESTFHFDNDFCEVYLKRFSSSFFIQLLKKLVLKRCNKSMI